MAKKKTEIEEIAETKVKQKKDKVEKVEEKESVKTKKSPAAKDVDAKLSKPEAPAKAVDKNSKKSTAKAVEILEVKVEETQSKEIVTEQKSEDKPKSTKDNESVTPVFNPNIRYSDEELQEFSVLITQEKETALDELRMLKERLDDLTSFDAADESMIYSMHMAEQGSEAQEKEKTYAQIQRIHEYIKKLEEAMERIKNKTYGICRVCGCLIAKERLRAVPITTLSASYKIHQKCPDDGIDKIEPVKK